MPRVRHRSPATASMIAPNGNNFMLVAYAYGWYDTIDLAVQGACVINLTSGQGLLKRGEAQTETRFQTTPGATELQNWIPETPAQCAPN